MAGVLAAVSGVPGVLLDTPVEPFSLPSAGVGGFDPARLDILAFFAGARSLDVFFGLPHWTRDATATRMETGTAKAK